MQEADRHSYDIHLEASVRPGGCDEETIMTRTNFRHLCAFRSPSTTYAPEIRRLHDSLSAGMLSHRRISDGMSLSLHEKPELKHDG